MIVAKKAKAQSWQEVKQTYIFLLIFFWKININFFKLCSLNSFGMFGGGLGTQRFIACGGQRLTVEVLSVFQRVELFMCFFNKKRVQLEDSRNGGVKSCVCRIWSGTSFREALLYMVFLLHQHQVEVSVQYCGKYENVLMFFLQSYFQRDLNVIQIKLCKYTVNISHFSQRDSLQGFRCHFWSEEPIPKDSCRSCSEPCRWRCKWSHSVPSTESVSIAS